MIISQTPLRISLAGGGTDFDEYSKTHGGLIISTAIDKYVFVIVKERYDDLIYISYMQKEIVRHVDEIQHELVREAMKKTGVGGGVEISMLADIPSEGSGLGSSSSLTVGLLNALYMYTGRQVPAEQLAREACEIEIEICRKPIGRQDQYIAAFGGICEIVLQGREVIVNRLQIAEGEKRKLGSNLLLFYTNTTRKSTTILTEQRSRIASTIDYLDMIKDLATQTRDSILNRDYERIGHCLDENWRMKKKLSSNVSNREIDAMYEIARTHGALGGKIAGAGGGGFLLCYCPRHRQDELREAMSRYREMPFLFEPDGSKIIFNYRRYSWK